MPTAFYPGSQAKHVELNDERDNKPQEPPLSNFESMICNMQQSLSQFMSFMQETMQNLLQSQNTLVQLLVSLQSK